MREVRISVIQEATGEIRHLPRGLDRAKACRRLNAVLKGMEGTADRPCVIEVEEGNAYAQYTSVGELRKALTEDVTTY